MNNKNKFMHLDTKFIFIINAFK